MAKHRIAPVVLALLLLLAGCGSGDDGATASNDTASKPPAGGPGGPKVELKDLKFRPEKITVDSGETVTWVWKENVLHNVAGDGFKSDNLSKGTFEHTFSKAGTYDYQCTLHAGMNGTVEVS